MKRDQKMSEFAEYMNKFMRQTIEALTVVDSQLNKLNIILFALLKDMDKLEDINCQKCGENITRPAISGLANKEECPACEENLIVDKQTTVEDWDNSSVPNRKKI